MAPKCGRPDGANRMPSVAVGEAGGQTRCMGAADRARSRLVDGLRDSGRLCSAAVEEAFRAVPRHLFLPGVPLARAYADEAVAVQAVDGVTTSSASQPSMMAIMLAQLDLRPGHRVLEIGAGTGYNAALMARIVGPGGHVVAVDIDAELVDGAARHLAAAGVSDVQLVCGDGALGHEPAMPYDRIVLTVGSGEVRTEWVAQLAPGGRLLLPLALRGTQLSVALDLGTDGALRSASVHRCAFVRLRGVGAVSEAGISVDGGVRVMPAAGTVRPELVRAALSAPGGTRHLPEPLGAADLWDGFGMWLALTEPGACRLLTRPADPDDLDPGGPSDEFVPVRGCAASIGILADATAGPGLAAVVLDPVADAGARGPWPVRVRAYGPAGDVLTERLLAAAASWTDAGKPVPEDLRLTVVPRGVEVAVAEAVAVVEQEHCRVFVHLPAIRPTTAGVGSA
jgi:protein-L-isoaspartate(D-aspartate) O-methyltransferase